MSTPQLNLLEESFSSQVYSLAQQEGSRLLKHVTQGTQESQTDYFPRISSVNTVSKSRTFADTPEHQIDSSMRGVSTNVRHLNTPILTKDMAEATSSLPSSYLQQAMMSHGRQYDIDILGQLIGNAIVRSSNSEGNYAQSNEGMSKKNRIAVLNAGATSLNGLALDVFPALNYHFDSLKIADSKKVIAGTVGGLYSLFKDTKFINNDYFKKMLLEDAVVEMQGPLGFTIVKLLPDVVLDTSRSIYVNKSTSQIENSAGSGNLTVAAESYDRLVVFCKTGFRYNLQTSQNLTKIDRRKDKSYDWQVYTRTAGGGVRMEEDKVLELFIKRPSVSFKGLGSEV